MTLCKCDCGKEVAEGKSFLPGHYSKWLRNQIEKKPNKTLLKESKKLPSVIIKKNGVLHWLKEKLKKKPKEILLTTSEIREMQIKQETEPSLSDEQKYKRFFGNLKKWTANKPGWFGLWRMKRRYPDATIKHCVFMDEDGDEYKQAYIYYNRELGYLQTDDAFYDIPLKDTKTIFLDSKRFTPLVNRKNYSDEYDIPEDHAQALLNTGIGYARLAQFKEVLAAILSLKMLNILAWIVVGIALIVLFLINYNNNTAIKMLAENVGNLTVAVKIGG